MSIFMDPPKDRRPLLIIVVGRQRVGKTTLLNTAVQFIRLHGGEVVVWNADKLRSAEGRRACRASRVPASASWLSAAVSRVAELRRTAAATASRNSAGGAA